jgi:hypothetical protein
MNQQPNTPATAPSNLQVSFYDPVAAQQHNYISKLEKENLLLKRKLLNYEIINHKKKNYYDCILDIPRRLTIRHLSFTRYNGTEKVDDIDEYIHLDERYYIRFILNLYERTPGNSLYEKPIPPQRWSVWKHLFERERKIIFTK